MTRNVQPGLIVLGLVLLVVGAVVLLLLGWQNGRPRDGRSRSACPTEPAGLALAALGGRRRPFVGQRRRRDRHRAESLVRVSKIVTAHVRGSIWLPNQNGHQRRPAWTSRAPSVKPPTAVVAICGRRRALETWARRPQEIVSRQARVLQSYGSGVTSLTPSANGATPAALVAVNFKPEES